MLSVANTRGERRITVIPQGIQRDISWDTPWRSATKRTKEGWNAGAGHPAGGGGRLWGSGGLAHELRR